MIHSVIPRAAGPRDPFRSETRYPAPMAQYWLYILASRSRVLYVGVTNDLIRRVLEHKSHLVPGFTRRYNVDRLVFFEATADVRVALAREKEVKGWRRAKKVALVEGQNPLWRDLAAEWTTTDAERSYAARDPSSPLRGSSG